MASTLLILIGIFSLLDGFAIWKAHKSGALKQLLEWVLPEDNHPGMGLLYTAFGLGLILVARAQPAPLFYPCYLIGGIMSFMGVRFFETGFARKFLEQWIIKAESKSRIWLPCITESVVGVYLLFAGIYPMLPTTSPHS